MDYKRREEERSRLTLAIEEWNESRLDLFEITAPDESLEFHGVMRFFYQDDGEKISTKCIRVASSATARDVIDTLVDKFHPDMRMLSLPKLSLYEVHNNGEERKLELNELPLRVQLNWTKDLREGRFLLRQINAKSKLEFYKAENEPPPGNFKRKLSKREKKEIKKKEKEAKLKGITLDDSQKPKLYDNLSKSNFTRTISNPEGVLRRKRQQKVDQMERYKHRPQSGGTLKVYAHSVFPEVPYKTLLISVDTTADVIVKESLEKFGHPKSNADEFCLAKVVIPRGADPKELMQENGWTKETIMDDDESPLDALIRWPESKGELIFELKRKPPNYQPRIKRPKQERLPYFLELNNDGTDIIDYKPKRHRLQLNVTEVGSQRDVQSKGPYLQLLSPGILPRHCVIANMEGVVTLTPTSPEAMVTVNDQKIYETTMLQHGAVVRFGQHYTYRFCDPKVEDPDWEERQKSLERNSAVVETTFDAVGNVETRAQEPEPPSPKPPPKQYILPATLEFREPGEDAFLAAIIREVNGGHVHFKLAPTYALYLACRFRLSKLYRPDMDLTERAQRLTPFINKLADLIDRTVQEDYAIAMAETFWLANGSEFLHFLQKDLDICVISQDAQDILNRCVQDSFRFLAKRIKFELNIVLNSFLDSSVEADVDKEYSEEQIRNMDNERWMTPPSRDQKQRFLRVGEVLNTLSSAMTLLRRCRVNAALTIQLFSQLFHFINVFIFNRVLNPPPHLRLCSREWGERLKKRLNRVYQWAEKQGLELAAEAHLAKITQSVQFMAHKKETRGDLETSCSLASKLNSRQLKVLLDTYMPGPGESNIPQDLIIEMVAIQRSINEEADTSMARPLNLEEDPELRGPIFIAEDGYSSDIVKGVPNGLPEFLEPLCRSGLVRFTLNPMAVGTWTVHMYPHPPPVSEEAVTLERLPTDEAKPPSPVPSPVQAPAPMPAPSPSPATVPVPQQQKPYIEPQVRADAKPPPEKTEPDVVIIMLDKAGSPSMGLSIVALKGINQEKIGVYIKAVVPGGAGAKDGRIKAGDQILEVDDHNIVGLDRDEATKYLVKSGRVVKLKIAQQGAIFHGLAKVLSQPSPPVQRAFKGQQQQAVPVPQPRPRSEDILRRNPQATRDDSGLHQQENPQERNLFSSIPGAQGLSQAKSSPNLVEEKLATLPHGQAGFQPPINRDRHSSTSTLPPGGPQPRHRIQQKGLLAQRSKSTSNLEPDPLEEDISRSAVSSTNLAHPPNGEQLYKGRAPREEPPFIGPGGDAMLERFDQEPYRRQPQPKQPQRGPDQYQQWPEQRPVPQPRLKANGGPPQRQDMPNRRNPPLGQRQGVSPNQSISQEFIRGQNRRSIDPFKGPGQRMNGNQNRGPNQLNRVNRPPGDHLRASSMSSLQQRAPPTRESHFPVIEKKPTEQRQPPDFTSPQLEVRHSPVQQSNQRGSPNQGLQYVAPVSVREERVQPAGVSVSYAPVSVREERVQPAGVSVSYAKMEEQDILPPLPPAPDNFDINGVDLPPPPDDLTSPIPDLQLPIDLPPPPPLQPELEQPKWNNDEFIDYQQLYDQEKQRLKQMEFERNMLEKQRQMEMEEVPPVETRERYASLPRQGRINQPSAPENSRTYLQRQSSVGPIPVDPPRPPNRGLASKPPSNRYNSSENGLARDVSITSLMPPVHKSLAGSPSAWEREEKEKQEQWYEDGLHKMKLMEIDDLLRMESRSPQQEERLRKLQLEMEFQKRLAETRDQSTSDEETEIVHATVKARMVNMVDDESDLSRIMQKPPAPAVPASSNGQVPVPNSAYRPGTEFRDRQSQRVHELQSELVRERGKVQFNVPPPRDERAAAIERERQLHDEQIKRQEEEMQRRHEQQRLEYARKEAQIEEQRLKLEQVLQLHSEPVVQAVVGAAYIPGPELPQVSATQYNPAPSNYSYTSAPRPFIPMDKKPPVARKPVVAPKPKLIIPNNHVNGQENGPPTNHHTAETNSYNDYNHTPPRSQQDQPSLATPQNSQNVTIFCTGETPGVIGAQEVYRDPYERKIMSQRLQNQKKTDTEIPTGKALSFKDRMKAFSEDGSPVRRPVASKWEKQFLAENPGVLEY